MSKTKPSLLHLHNINVHFDVDDRKLLVLENISLDVHQGEFLMLLGPSGSGKSTLLRVMCGLLKPSAGQIVGQPFRQAMVFQDFALFPWLTVEDNIGFGLHMLGESKQKHKVVTGLINHMGLMGFENAYPRELSGGMKQRVGIARALAISPDIIFLDEPFSALDTFTATKLRAELLDIWQRLHITIVMVTHSIEESLLMSDRIAVLGSRPASVIAVIENKLVRPRNPHGNKFLQQVDKITKLIKD